MSAAVALAPTLGPCWFEHCTRPGVTVVAGVDAVPLVEEAKGTAERITRMGLVVCDEHALVARRMAAS